MCGQLDSLQDNDQAILLNCLPKEGSTIPIGSLTPQHVFEQYREKSRLGALLLYTKIGK